MSANVIFLDDTESVYDDCIRHVKKHNKNNCKIVHFDEPEKLRTYLSKLKSTTGQFKEFLMILDLDIDGNTSKVIQLIQDIKTGNLMSGNSTHRIIPIVVFSHTDEPAEIDKCYDSGANLFVHRLGAEETEKQFLEIINLYSSFGTPPRIRYSDNDNAK